MDIPTINFTPSQPDNSTIPAIPPNMGGAPSSNAQNNGVKINFTPTDNVGNKNLPVQNQTQQQPTFGGPTWLGSKQMSAIDFTNQSAIKQYAQAIATTIPEDFGTIINSAGNLAKGIGSSVINLLNPDQNKNTIATAGKAIAGGIESIPGISKYFNNSMAQSDKQAFGSIVSYFGKKYGGNSPQDVLKNITNTAGTDPVGTLFDLSMLLDGVGGATSAISKIGQAGDIAELTAGMSDADKMAFIEDASRSGAFGKGMEIGQKISDTGEALNPITNTIKAGGAALQGAKDLASTAKENIGEWYSNKNLGWEKNAWTAPTEKPSGFNKATDIYNGAKARGNDIAEILTNDGVKLADNVEEGRFSTADTAEKIRNDASKASNEMLRPALEEANPGVQKVSVDDAIKNAKSQISNDRTITAGDKQTLLNNLDKEASALKEKYPDGMSLTDMHDEKITYGQNVKRNPMGDVNLSLKNQANEALRDTFKNLVEQKAPKSIPVKEFNAELQKQYQAADYLDNLDDKKVPTSLKGQIAKLGGKLAGGSVGNAVAGPFGAYVGYKIAGMVENMLNDIPANIRGSFLDNLEKTNPEAFKQVSEYMKQSAQERSTRLLLPAAGETTNIPTEKPAIQLPDKGVLKGQQTLREPTTGNYVEPPTHNIIEKPKQELPSLKAIHEGYNRLYNTYVRHFRGNGT